MKLKLIPLILASAVVLPGCVDEKGKQSDQPAAPAVTKENAAASVNGVYISKTTLETLQKDLAQRGQGQSLPREQLLEELIQREVLIQQAKQKKLDAAPELVERLENLKNALLSQAAVQDYIKTNPITDEDLKREYDSKVSGQGDEYKARHILVKTEDEAKKIIADLDKGAKFTELAKKFSTDPMGAEGGDLGWFTADRMVAPFSEAVKTLENGKYTKQPVQTQFGWHVILREDSRPITPPPFDSVKEQIRSMMQRERVQNWIEGLTKTAKVEILLPADKPAEPAAAAPAPAPAAEPAGQTAPTPAEQKPAQ